MKCFSAIALLLLLYACREKPVQNGPRPRFISIDSIPPRELSNPYAPIDLSPMDMSYLPADHPKMVGNKADPIARVIYSRPHKQGRKIFGQLVKYGEPWRLGANEATEIEFFRNVRIGGKTVNKGKYVLYCIPYPDKWVIALNKKLYSWGLALDSTQDAHRFDASISILKNQTIEYFSIVFRESGGTAELIMAWDNVEGRLPIEIIP